MTNDEKDLVRDPSYLKGTADSPKRDVYAEEIKEMAIDMEFLLAEPKEEETS